MRAALPAFVGLILCAVFGGGLIRASGPTYDEPVHLAAGHTDLVYGCCRLNALDHPPLAEMWAAIPSVKVHPNTFPSHPAWLEKQVYHYGDLFLFSDHLGPKLLLNAGRMFNLLTLSAVLSLLVVLWCLRLGGASAAAGGALAVGLCIPWFSNAALITTDALSSLLFFASFAVLSVKERSWRRWAVVGALAGLALASKFNMILLPPLLAFSLLAESRVEKSKPEPLRWALAAACAVLALCAVYRGAGPALWWQGLNATLARLSEGRAAFLHGRHSTTGWLWYFPVAILVKTPLPLLLCAAWGARRVLKGPRREAAWLLLPPALYLLASLTSKTQIGYRHVLPLYPFLCVLAGLGGAALWDAGGRARAGAFGLAAWLGLSVAANHPYHLAYFNELAGRRAGGAAWLADSNLDWGQDLPSLAKELQARGNPPFVLSYFGSDDPAYHGLRYVPLGMVSNVERPGNAALEPGKPLLLAISQTNRAGVYFRDHGLWGWLASRAPIASPGGSIFLYDLSADEKGRAILSAMLSSSGRPGDAKTALLH